MLLFFVAAAVLTLIVAAVLVRPLLKPLAPPSAPGRYNMAVYRDQLEELERDAARASLDPAQAAAARLEIERRLIAAAREAAPVVPPRRAPRALALALVALLFLGGVAIYLVVGRPMLPDQPLQRQLAEASDPHTADRHAEMSRLVAVLAQKLSADPNHPDGWALLARSYLQLGQPDEAVHAYARAISLKGGDDPALDREYAQARVMAANGQVDAPTLAIFRRLNAADPKDPQARYYLALAKSQGGDRAGALADWRALAADAPAGAPWLPMVRQHIAEVSGQPPPAEASTAPPGPSPADVAAAARLGEADRSAMVQGMVERLASRLKAQPDDLEGWRRLARAYTVLGQPAQAQDAWRQVQRLSPGDPDARAALGGGGG